MIVGTEWLWSGEGLFIGIFEAQNLGGGKILPPPT